MFRNFNLLNAAHHVENNERMKRMNLRRKDIRQSTDVYDMPDREFIKRYRLPQDIVQDIVTAVSPYMPVATRTNAVSVDVKVLAALGFFATGSYQRVVGNDYNIVLSQPMVSRSIEQVSTAINDHLLKRYIKFPVSNADRNAIKLRFFEETGFPGVIGAVDCTHIGIVKPSLPHLEERFFNRKSYHSLNVSAVCDFDMRILSISPRYAGRAGDCFVWKNSRPKRALQERYNAGERGEWLIGDSGYASEPWLLLPILDAEEHSPEEHYTKTHCKARCCIERCFGLLKARWRCLLRHRILHYDPVTASKIINTCAALHNIAIDARLPPPEPITEEDAAFEQRLEAGDIAPNPIDINVDFLGHAREVRDQVVRRLWQLRP